MSISFKCPKCRKPFKLADKLAGRQGKCPDCGKQFKIPAGNAPVTQEMPSMPGDPFAVFDPGADTGDGESYQPRYRRKRGMVSQLLGCMFLLIFLLVAAAGGAYAAIYFKLIKADPYLAKIPFKIPGLTTAPQGDSTAPEGTAKGPADTTAKEDPADPKKENPEATVPFEYRFLPDKFALLISVNVDGLTGSKVYQKVKTTLTKGAADADKTIDEGTKASIGVPLSGIGRIVLGAKTKDDAIMVYRTKQPITAAEVMKNRKTEFTEEKIGKYVMYKAKDDPFCLVDDHMLLVGKTSEALKKVLERDKPPEMIPDLQAVFKQVTAAKTISLAGGPQEVRKELDEMNKAIAAFKPPMELQPLFDSQAFALQADLASGIEFTANLQCKDAAGAEALKKAAEEKAGAGRGYFEAIAKANAGKGLEAMATAASQAIGQVKYSVTGDTITATAAVSEETGANLVMLALFFMAPEPPKK